MSPHHIYKKIILCALASLSFFMIQAQPYSILGPSVIDVSSCSTTGPSGKVDAIFWIQRAPNITGPGFIKLLTAIPDVTVSISPAQVTFPGGAIAEPIAITFEIIPGTIQNNQILHFGVFDDKANSFRFDLVLSGVCPQHNHDFVIRGDFQSVQANVSFPVEGAIVEIYRDVPYWYDQFVGSTITDSLGHYEVRLWADDVDTYYAKLRLNDGTGVYMRDWWSTDILDFNSFNRGDNDQPIVELGTTIISRDNGAGTPKTAVWQGGHTAFQEFIDLFGTPPPTGDYEIVNQNTPGIGPWTARSTTNYLEGTPTFDPQRGLPVPPSDISHFRPYFSAFRTYRSMFHEFGHALRHTVDGNQPHFVGDAARWTYGRPHTICGSNPGYIESEGYAFNEAWAYYWEFFPPNLYQDLCKPVNLFNMENEGAVMNDLHAIAHALHQCDGGGATFNIDIAKNERRKMFSVINQGENIIHSDGEFRSVASQLFPGCPLPAIGVGTASSPIIVEPTELTFVQANVIQLLRDRIIYYRQLSKELRNHIPEYQEEIKVNKDCKDIPCKEFAGILIRPIITKAKSKYADMVADMYASRLQLSEKDVPLEDRKEIIDRTSDKQLTSFKKKVDELTLQTLGSVINTLNRKGQKENTDISSIRRKLEAELISMRLQHPMNDHQKVIFDLPPAPGDDVVAGDDYRMGIQE